MPNRVASLAEQREQDVLELIGRLLTAGSIFSRPAKPTAERGYTLEAIDRSIPPIPTWVAQAFVNQVASIAVPLYGAEAAAELPSDRAMHDTYEVIVRVQRARQAVAELLPLANSKAEEKRLMRFYNHTVQESELLLPRRCDYPPGNPRTPQRARFLRELAGLLREMFDDAGFDATNEVLGATMLRVLETLGVEEPGEETSLTVRFSKDWRRGAKGKEPKHETGT
jgi:hypothetical protein